MLKRIEEELIEEHNKELDEAIQHCRTVIEQNQSLIKTLENMKDINTRKLATLKGGHGSGTAGFGSGAVPEPNRKLTILLRFETERFWFRFRFLNGSKIDGSGQFSGLFFDGSGQFQIGSGRFLMELEPSVPTRAGTAGSRFQNWWNQNRTGLDWFRFAPVRNRWFRFRKPDFGHR
ncbi:hypothetical protein JCGZ_10553 [Jatropha curcas]|uniref:Uncharacterized protein n=1 Tax=Jatropha curcas TaxID=180498 RepID=A0A067KIG9_JATCU|nr:hypothetical protein JCGZ_10553 [Jatropha curcas]